MSSATDNSRTPPAAAGEGQVELAISGMTCASCAARIEKRLNKLDGVTATVNYATEKARVSYSNGIAHDDLERPSRRPDTPPGYPSRPVPPAHPRPAPRLTSRSTTRSARYVTG